MTGIRRLALYRVYKEGEKFRLWGCRAFRFKTAQGFKACGLGFGNSRRCICSARTSSLAPVVYTSHCKHFDRECATSSEGGVFPILCEARVLCLDFCLLYLGGFRIYA